ncbi:MAG: hypothetical protein LBP75_01330 [Planctomycetota bacterium]|nr:hypothetical protein [Planctomycetota bacterium]
MHYYPEIDPIVEVWENRKKLFEMYGGIEGLHRHMDEERPLLERAGWVFVEPEVVRARQTKTVNEFILPD